MTEGEDQHDLEGLGKSDKEVREGFSKEQLASVYAEEDTTKQFEIFASYLAAPVSAHGGRAAALKGIALEYYFLNVIFCREQSFTPEQTSAFHGIARKVFEAGIERGELDLEGAFQAFTDMVLALAVVVEGDTPTTESTLNPAPGLACGGSDDGAPGRRAVERRGVDPKAYRAATIVEGSLQNSNPSNLTPGAGRDGGGERNGSGATSLFSVGDVAVITEFVARGLYRNFTLYRMCFQENANYCEETRIVQVETPLAPPPLRLAEETKVAVVAPAFEE